MYGIFGQTQLNVFLSNSSFVLKFSNWKVQHQWCQTLPKVCTRSECFFFSIFYLLPCNEYKHRENLNCEANLNMMHNLKKSNRNNKICRPNEICEQTIQSLYFNQPPPCVSGSNFITATQYYFSFTALQQSCMNNNYNHIFKL